MAALYAFGLFGFVSYFIYSATKKDKKIRWGALEAIGVTIFIYFIGQLIGGLIAFVIAAAFGYDRPAALDWIEKSTYGQFVSIVCIEAVSLGLLYVFLKRRGANWRNIGLGGKLKWSDIGYALVGYLVYFVLYLGALNLVSALLPNFNAEQQQQIGFEKAHGLQLVAVFVSLVVLPPLVEEILMRGFLYSGLRKHVPKVAAVIITSSLFAAAHLQAGSGAALLWVAAVDTFVLSLVLIYLRERTGKLWSSIGLHSLKNFVAFLSLFVFHVAK